MNVLMVLTSHDQLGETGKKTGFWLEEFASPYYTLLDAGAKITLASPKGGQPPLDPMSEGDDFQTEATQRFNKDDDAKQHLANTKPLESVQADEFDAVFYPGGHGPLWDLANDKHSIQLIEQFAKSNKPIAAVCHAPAVLVNVKHQGNSIVQDKNVTGFSNSEEEAVELTDVVPFLLEDKLKQLGGSYTKTDDWASHVVIDDNLITGQNPASSESTAKALLERLK